MNEIPEILSRAIAGPIDIEFIDRATAKAWRFRAYNYIRRHRPELAQLMFTLNGATISVGRPEIVSIKESK